MIFDRALLTESSTLVAQPGSLVRTRGMNA